MFALIRHRMICVCIPKQEHNVEVPCLQIREHACLALFNLVPCRHDHNFWRSMHGRGAARGRAFGVIFDSRDLVNGRGFDVGLCHFGCVGQGEVLDASGSSAESQLRL